MTPRDGSSGGWAALTGVGSAALAPATGLSAAEAISAYDLSGKAGEVARLVARTPAGVVRLILLGVGDGSPAELRRAGAALARQVEHGQKAVAALRVLRLVTLHGRENTLADRQEQRHEALVTANYLG